MADPSVRRRGLAGLLSWCWIVVIVYASLFPFVGWRWPAGAAWPASLLLPWPRFHAVFDIGANALAYLPLGLLLALGRRSAARASATLRATVFASGLSYAMELLQFGLPQRVPSLLDWILNTVGALFGAWLGGRLRDSPARARLDAARERWFERHGPAGLALLVLWPAALLFPTPVTLGLGQIWDRLRDQLADVLSTLAWAEPLLPTLTPGNFAAGPLAPSTEALAVALGLLGPCMSAYCMADAARRRLVLAVGAALLGAGMTTLSTALNFGPQHAFAWATPTALGGIGFGLLLASAMARCHLRVAAGIGLVAITASVVLVAQAPADPYFAESLSSWEQGRFIRFHGLAQWIGWCWPYAAMAWLLARIGGHEA